MSASAARPKTLAAAFYSDDCGSLPDVLLECGERYVIMIGDGVLFKELQVSV